MVRPARLKSLASLVVGFAVVLACMAGIPAASAAPTAAATHPATASADSLTPHYRGNAPYDARDLGGFAVQPTAAQASARAGLAASLGEQGVVDIDPLTGTPRVIARLDGFLTPPSGLAPAKIVTDYVRGHIDSFGLSAADLSSFRLVRDYVDIGGTHHLYWVQSFDGVPSFDHGLIASVTSKGELVNVLGSPMAGLFVHSTQPSVSANSAVSLALRNSGASDTTPAPLVSQSPGKTRAAVYANGDSASLVLFGDARGTTLAWQVSAQASSTEHDLSVVDSTTGAVLWRTNQVDFADVTGHGLAWQYVDTTLLPPGVGRQQTHSFPVASAQRLAGNNAHVFADVNDDNHPKAGAFPNGDEIPASNPGTKTWAYHVSANTSTPARNCNPKFVCTWNSGVRRSWQTNLRQNATQVYYYLNNYHDHLNAAPIGFTEAAGNFELVNSTHLGRGNDPVLGQIDDGANTAGGVPDGNHQDNANMFTPPDGHSPTMQMYLFPANTLNHDNPDANGGDEADIVYHEYTHGLSNRLVTNAQGIPSLNSFQSAAMGEAWSDWYAMDFLAKQGFQKDTSTAGDVRLGFYTGGGHTQPIRSEGMDCPASQNKPLCHGAGNAGPGGYTLGDMGKIASNGFQTFPEVHADGEIWGQTLWQIRQRLIASLGPAAGVARAEAIVTRAMELSPPSPSFLDERNAILQADQVNFSGQDRDLLWSVFASRGMGFFAHMDSGNDIKPVQNFDTPPDCSNPTHCGTVQGTVTDADTSNPIAGALVGIVDHMSGGTTQSPDNLVDVTAADGSYSIPDVPHHNGYTLVVVKAGYEPSPIQVSVQSATVTKDRAIHFDWAADSAGASVISFTPPDYSGAGCGPRAAIDLTDGSGWGSDSVTNHESGFGGPRQITIRLPHAVDITEFGVDPSPACIPPDGAAAALKTFKIEVKTASGPFHLARGTTTAGSIGHITTFPATGPANNVVQVRFIMLSNRGDHNFMDMTELTVHGTAS